MLPLAKKMLQNILATLKPEIERGMPIVVLEPSCAAVFRDELVNLFPDDPLAKKLRDQTFLLSEFLAEHPHPLPKLSGAALVQAHCHHRSIMGFDPEKDLLEKLGLKVTVPEAGCCGMAGAFGFEKDHYAVSMKIAERSLIPALQNASPENLIIADGFSCREQIQQTTGRRALHLAEVLQMAMKEK
jgi:Fe-S oxidoreductase